MAKKTASTIKDMQRRKKVMSYGFIECSICNVAYPVNEYYAGERDVSGRCYHCRRKSHTPDYDRHSKTVLSPTEKRAQEVLRRSGYRKCINCQFTLPLSEYKSFSSEKCRECAGNKNSTTELQKYLARYSLKKCSCCNSIKDIGDFYKKKSGEPRFECKGCAKTHLNNWKINNPVKAALSVRNALNKRRAFKRLLPSRPISKEEEDVLRSVQNRIFGSDLGGGSM